jgi:hypothetical protein
VSITWRDVVLIAPELSAVGVATQDAILADVALQLSAERWGNRLDIASKYLAAHLATVTQRSGVAGPVTSESVGSVSRSYSVAAQSGAFDATAYGREYKRLQRSLVDRIGVVT